MSEPQQYHELHTSKSFIEVVLPLALPNTFTYYVPEDLVPEIQFGVRVEVPFGKNKLYSALVTGTNSEPKKDQRIKAVLSVLDKEPIINEKHWKFWKWMAQYYCCTVGEVMSGALPGNMKLTGETRIVLSPLYDQNLEGLTDNEFMIAEALNFQEELTLDDVRKILNIKSVYRVIAGLIDKKVIYLKEELVEKFKPKKISCLRLLEPYASDPKTIEQAFELCSRSEKQQQALLAFLQI